MSHPLLPITSDISVQVHMPDSPDSRDNGRVDVDVTDGEALATPQMTAQYEIYCNDDDTILVKVETNGGTTREDGSSQRCMWNSCQRRFPRNSDALVNHVNDEHVRVDKETEYICRWQGCPRRGKAFNARYKMLIHIRTHTNERPHRCRDCGKSFSRLENLKIHHRSHTGEKPYSCPVEGCKKAYSNSSDRFKHTRTHFDDKPYVCKRLGCDKRYTDPSSLRKHMKTYGHYREDRDLLLPNNTLRKEVTLDAKRQRSGVKSAEISAGQLRQLQKSHFVIDVNSFGSDDALLSVAAAAVFGNPFLSEKRVDVGGVSAAPRCSHLKREEPNKTYRCQASPLDLTVSQTDSRCSTSPGVIVTGKWGFPVGSN